VGITITITIVAPVTPTFAPIADLCEGSTAPSLPTTSQNVVEGEWLPASINTSVIGTTPYTFTPSTGICATPITINVTVNALPAVDSFPNGIACLSDGGFELQPLSSGNSYYTGPSGTGQQLNPGDFVDFSTIYVFAQSGTTPNCFNESSFTVTIVEVMAQDLSDVEECGRYVLPELAAGNAYYTDANATGTQLQPGTEITEDQLIYVYATNNGCFAQSEFQVTINNCTIQKGISPNNDGSNDFFDLESYNVDKLEIFNRYGIKVYSKNNYENEWYGQTDSGDELPDGTYYYVIYFTEGNNSTGWIYINRVR
jgi:gliding motility-associated-like protein